MVGQGFVLCFGIFICVLEVIGDRTPKKEHVLFGAIFDWKDIEAKTGFLFGVKQFNQRNSESFRLSVHVEVIGIKDSFNLATSICNHMDKGVFMLFGGRKFESSSIIEAYAQTFHVPYVSPSFADNVRRELPNYQLHMRPSHTRALVDLIQHYKWQNFHYVYNSEEGLYRVQEIIRILQAENTTVNVRMRMLHDVENAHEDLRSLDKQDLGTGENNNETFILLDLAKEAHYHDMLRQIREVGMNKHGYYYILGTLDFLHLETQRYQHGGVNITGFQLVNYSSPYVQRFMDRWGELKPHIWPGASNTSIHIDAALAADAIEVIHRALARLIRNSASMFKHTFRRGEIYNYNRTRGVPCDADPPVPWMHGAALMEGMRELHFDGVTGNIEFDEYGFRKNYKFDIYNVGLNNGPDKIGQWSTKGGVYNEGEEKPLLLNKTGNSRTIYTIVSIEDEPFLMKRMDMDKDGKPMHDTLRYEGYCVDLAAMIAKYVNFEYKIKLVDDSLYGVRLDTEDNTTRWNGMIGELIEDKAQLAVAPLSITSEREKEVDFSKPFMESGISIMIKQPEKKKPGVFSFFQPFTLNLWLSIVFSYFGVGFGMFLVSRCSGADWRRNRYSGRMEYNKFNLANSLWFAMGSLMLQGSDDACPRSTPGRIIGGAWWFAVLITISSYTANLAAFLTIEKLLTPIDSADDLVKQTEIAYGTLGSGSTQSFFKDSKVSIYREMWLYMESANPSVFADNITEGIQRVRKSRGKYAFLLESVYNEYANNRKPCNTMQVGNRLNQNHYGIATRKGFPFRDEITLCVLRLTEDGSLERMRKEWWVDKGECGFATGNRESKKKSLSLSNVAGAYFILIAGLVVAIIIGVCEFIYVRSQPETVPSSMVYMMPGVESLEPGDDSAATEDTLGGASGHAMLLGNHNGATNGPASPINGNARSTGSNGVKDKQHW